MNPTQTLFQYFGYSAFRTGQLEIVTSILHRKDTLVIMPTGGGKSICFQVPGLMMEGTTLVISPLISLMKDQVDTLVKKKIPATFINSSLSSRELISRLQLIKLGRYKFIYIAPERLQTTTFIQACQNLTISLMAIDEAHCISQWGHDFRPSYTQISDFIDSLTKRPTIAAFTATATPQVQQDISTQLQLIKPNIFHQGFRRENLTYSVINCPTDFNQEINLFKILKKHFCQSGIIFVSTRQTAEYLDQLLHHFNYATAFYHAGLDKDRRSQIQENFLNNTTKIIVATNAFGMGVDKPDIRFVIHYQLPGNLENYYQEAGRAGRDRQPASCYLFFNQSDIAILSQFIDQAHPDQKDYLRKLNYQKLKTMIGYTQTKQCRVNYVLSYFGETSNQKNCDHCDNCHHHHNYQSRTQPGSHSFIIEHLTNLRTQLSQKYHLHPKKIMTDKVIQLIELHQPQSKTDFLKIPGIGLGWYQNWGKLILKNIDSFSKSQNFKVVLSPQLAGGN